MWVLESAHKSMCFQPYSTSPLILTLSVMPSVTSFINGFVSQYHDPAKICLVLRCLHNWLLVYTIISRLNCTKHFYNNQTIRIWNSLPPFDLHLSYVTLKTKLKNFFWNYNFPKQFSSWQSSFLVLWLSMFQSYQFILMVLKVNTTS